MLEYDMCWCVDGDKCGQKDCFRNIDNKPVSKEREIFTAGSLYNTHDCEMRNAATGYNDPFTK